MAVILERRDYSGALEIDGGALLSLLHLQVAIEHGTGGIPASHELPTVLKRR